MAQKAPTQLQAMIKAGQIKRADQLRRSAYQRGYDRKWSAMSALHRRLNPVCVFCGHAAEVVDHIVPVQTDPSRVHDPTNMRSLCRECHGQVTANFMKTGRNEMPK